MKVRTLGRNTVSFQHSVLGVECGVGVVVLATVVDRLLAALQGARLFKHALTIGGLRVRA